MDNQPNFLIVQGPIIVGAGPSGLAVSACLKSNGIPSLILERSDCLASLWQQRTYDRLKLHIPKHFCQLPLFGFPTVLLIIRFVLFEHLAQYKMNTYESR